VVDARIGACGASLVCDLERRHVRQRIARDHERRDEHGRGRVSAHGPPSYHAKPMPLFRCGPAGLGYKRTLCRNPRDAAGIGAILANAVSAPTSDDKPITSYDELLSLFH